MPGAVDESEERECLEGWKNSLKKWFPSMLL